MLDWVGAISLFKLISCTINPVPDLLTRETLSQMRFW